MTRVVLRVIFQAYEIIGSVPHDVARSQGALTKQQQRALHSGFSRAYHTVRKQVERTGDPESYVVGISSRRYGYARVKVHAWRCKNIVNLTVVYFSFDPEIGPGDGSLGPAADIAEGKLRVIARGALSNIAGHWHHQQTFGKPLHPDTGDDPTARVLFALRGAVAISPEVIDAPKTSWRRTQAVIARPDTDRTRRLLQKLADLKSGIEENALSADAPSETGNNDHVDNRRLRGTHSGMNDISAPSIGSAKSPHLRAWRKLFELLLVALPARLRQSSRPDLDNRLQYLHAPSLRGGAELRSPMSHAADDGATPRQLEDLSA
ncbi:MAG: hypothetical protein NW205_00580 [Hyphomicrobiaceae bacterium]|nr:hypothetical protein [Hyphomicrobiaceae bacterium]